MILAALATIPGREEALERCLASLRPQVNEIRVVCHDRKGAPACVRKYADAWACVPDHLGSAAKLRWVQDWDGYYLACDDDVEYPPEYADIMAEWVEGFDRKALVTCHGRILSPDSMRFHDTVFRATAFKSTEGRWINYPGGLGLAFHTDLRPPRYGYVKSCEEAGLAIWAQNNSVPIWLVPHDEDWLKWLEPPGDSIWSEEKATGFTRRNGVLRQLVDGGGQWRVVEYETVPR